jgi:hypothetical protein
MNAILSQDLLSISEAAKRIPTRPHVATVWRWIEKGCRGHRLESWLVGGQRYTSMVAIETFLHAINSGSAKSVPMTAKTRQKAIEKAEAELVEMGL